MGHQVIDRGYELELVGPEQLEQVLGRGDERWQRYVAATSADDRVEAPERVGWMLAGLWQIEHERRRREKLRAKLSKQSIRASGRRGGRRRSSLVRRSARLALMAGLVGAAVYGGFAVAGSWSSPETDWEVTARGAATTLVPTESQGGSAWTAEVDFGALEGIKATDTISATLSGDTSAVDCVVTVNAGQTYDCGASTELRQLEIDNGVTYSISRKADGPALSGTITVVVTNT